MTIAARLHLDRRDLATCTTLLVGCALTIPVFWWGLSSLGEAWSRPEYSHGPLIPLISGYLFLRQLRDEDQTPVARAAARPTVFPGILVGVIALILAVIGTLTRIPDIVTYGLIVWVFAVTVTGFGWNRGSQFWPPILHLVFMLPLPNMIYWKLSLDLQFISSEIGVMLVQLMDIPVFLDGNIIDLGAYKLHVAEACSGLRYLFPVLSFSYIFAVLYKGPIWQKAIMLLSAAPITILMNSFRIGVIGILVDRYGIEHAEGFLHFFEGWVIFFTCISILFLLAYAMKRAARDRRPLADAIDLDYSGVPAAGWRLLQGGISRPVALLVALAVLTGALLHLPPSAERSLPVRTPLAIFPEAIGEWRGSHRLLDPAIEDVLGADDYLSATYTSPMDRIPVDLFIAYYDKMTEGSGVHSPEVCLPAGGWEMSEIQPMTIMLRSDSGLVSTPVNRAIIQKGVSKQLVYYWFDQRGRRLTSDYAAKAYVMLDAAMHGRADGGLVRAITPIELGEDETSAENRLQRFLSAANSILPDYLPE